MPKRKLTEEAQAYIVHSLACFDAPSEIVKEVKRLFGFDVRDAEVQRYHPNSASALKRGLSKKWIDLFEASRAAYIAATSDVDNAAQFSGAFASYPNPRLSPSHRHNPPETWPFRDFQSVTGRASVTV